MRYIRIEWRWERHKNMDGSPAKQWRETVPASPQRTKAFNEQKKKTIETIRHVTCLTV